MNCAVCGEICRCADSVVAPEDAAVNPAEAMNTASPAADMAAPDIGPSSGSEAAPPDATNTEWRSELASRLTRYRARRRMPPPRYPSLRLPFDAATTSREPEQNLPTFEPVSDHALALDGMRQQPDPTLESHQETVEAAPEASAPSHSAKIIEFPRFAWAPPPPPLDQLAEPVGYAAPRILEVPEVAPPPPALGGITIEPAQRQELAKRPGIDIPLHAASLPRRIAATFVDGLIIAVACALAGFIFWKVAAVRPPLAVLAGLAVGVPCLFWAVYQYLLLVYSAGTPGLRAAGLQLSRFDGSPANRSLRRWRVLASYLSAASLGMGYAWVFLDEDSLCWHDRITRTYLGPKKSSPQ